jgi:GT2 family glycosyltransferase/glycosyltransferase involved in cell wall biosynthesis/Tfp pilus assembly protein PilF
MNSNPSPSLYPALPLSSSGAATRKLRVCIASFDFVGPVRNGGVGTAFTSLGEALAAAGHEVTLLFVSGQFCENGTLDQWVAYYKKKGIRFVPMPVSFSGPIGAPWHVFQSYQAYLWLLAGDFDVIHFSEWKGPGYFTLLAKHQGLAFARTLLCVHTHGPTLWHKLSNSELVTQIEDLENDFVERASVKLADVVVSPSHYLLDWMKEQGWELPSECYVQQYVRPATARKPLPGRGDAPHRVEELVFFGRLEHRKGLVLFCDALDKLCGDRELAGLKITFLGKPAEINGQVATEYIGARAGKWPWKCQVIGDRDQACAMDYLQGGPRLAVLPSLVDNLPNTVLECLGASLPFIAGNTGGIPEMIAPEDLDATLFSLRPVALAEKLRYVVRHGIRPARSAVEPTANECAWVTWHERTGLTGSSPSVSVSPANDQPLVSVCMAHWNRPRYLAQALASIEAQDYPNIEVVVVDDCSSQPETIAYLDSLEPLFRKRGWQLLRQAENRFPGAARNRAVSAARGEYILFMDDDNVAKPNEISTFVRVARKTGADVLTCFLDTFDGQTAPTAQHKINSRVVFLGGCTAAGALRNWFGDTNSLVRRDVFLALGGFHEQWGVNHEDYEFMARAVLRGYRLEVVPEALVWYRVNEGETSVLRSTPFHGNIMCSIRPYLESVPPELRNLILYAQGTSVRSSEAEPANAKALRQYAELTIRWRSKLEAGLVLAGLNQKAAAVNTMIEAIKSLETSNNAKVILEALLAIGPHLKPLDAGRGRYLLELALKLAQEIKHGPGQEQARALLKGEIQKTAPAGKGGTGHSHGSISVKPKEISIGPVSAESASPSQVPEACSIVPRVSIIIPTFNNLALTRQCLDALSRNTPAGSYELVVVDNGSNDGTLEFLREKETAGELRVICNPKNLGFARACNQGAQIARSSYLLLLNNDTEVQPGWLDPLLHILDADPQVAATGGKLLFPDGTIQHAGVALADAKGRDPLMGFHPFAKEKSDFGMANERRVCQAVTAACALVRKSLFEKVGGLDEGFWNGYEDVDLCLQFQERGYLTVYEPASVVFHHESQSGPERFMRVKENIQRLHQKWLGKVMPDFVIEPDGRLKSSPSSKVRPYVCPTVSTAEKNGVNTHPDHSGLVSIIILAHNLLGDTRQCLASIEQHTPTSHELILVDNGSTDGTPEFFRKYASTRNNVRVVVNQTNLGFSAGNNLGLALARGGAVLLLNNDTVVTEGWIERMLAVFERHPEVGLVGPLSNSVSGPQLVSPVKYSRLADLPAFAAQLTSAQSGQSLEVPRLVGFCLLMRRAVVEKIGGLDPQFGSGNFEDDDLCLRAGFAGFKLRIARDAFVHHTGGQTFKGAKIDYRASMLRNWDLFKAKWGMPKDQPIEKGYRLPAALPIGMPVNISLPEVQSSHQPSSDSRCWTAKTLSPHGSSAAPKPSSKPVPIKLPPCALIGHLAEARELLKKKNLRAAWEATLAAIAARPFHPEAHLLLAEITQAAGDSVSARDCAQHARNLAPEWKPAKQFLKGPLRGNTKPDWVQLPATISNARSKAALRLSVCLITRNEENFLGQCLASVRALASQIIVVDTGSTDRTVQIAREHGAEIHQFAWCDDFSAARNEALKHATGDWILALDADEELLPEHRQTILQEMQSAAVMGYRLPIIDKGREQEGCSYVPRFFRNAPGLFFVGRVHEQAFSSIAVRCREWGLENRLGKAALLHHGYTPEVVASREKIARNLRLLELAIQELPGEPNLLMSLGLERVRSGQLEAGLDHYREALHLMSASPVGQIVPELRETLLTQLTTHLLKAGRFTEIVQLWETPFAKSAGLTASQHFLLGLAHLELKQPADAAEQMRQCLDKRHRPALSPVHKDILKAGPNHCLALSLVALKQTAEAEQAFHAALAEEPQSRSVRFDFARFQIERNQPLEALKRLNQLVAEDPNEVQVWQFGAQIALSRPDFVEFARDWTGEAFKHCSQDPTIILQRAEALVLTQEVEQALPLWIKAHSPKSARHLAALVLCECLTGDCERSFPAADEKVVSQEFQKWYLQLINSGANSLVYQLHESMEKVRLVLPTFATAWERAMSVNQSPQTALSLPG